MKHLSLFIGLSFLWVGFAENVSASDKVIQVSAPPKGYCNDVISQALTEAAEAKGSPVTIQLELGRYVFSRNESVQQLYHVSNTTSEVEDADPTKHIGLCLKKLENVMIDGNGSLLLMDGEMTSFVIDSCRNITLKNFSLDFIAPTQTEMEVVEQGKNHLLAKVHPTSHYRIKNGKLQWYGNGWSFSGGIAQVYDREKDMTWRDWSPMDGLENTVEVKPGLLWMNYKKKPEVKPGWTFQMRDAIRDEVCGLIQHSRDVRLENIHIFYAGNFGVVGQYSENLTLDHVFFEPEDGSERTNVGFADFLQVSGCKGKLLVQDCRFVGAHDDPINVHGTHLEVVGYLSDRKVKLKFMHHQTYGLKAFSPGDEVSFIHSHTLLPLAEARVKKVSRVDDRHLIIELNRPLPDEVKKAGQVAVENLTWTPEVHIRNNYFSRIPTRGILVTTRRNVLIENNIFHRTTLSAILIANDALSWFESGPVRNVVIRHNKFIECGEPVVWINPKNKQDGGPVHRNISIVNNHFQLKGKKMVNARSTDGLTVTGNLIGISDTAWQHSVVDTTGCERVKVKGNRFYIRNVNVK